MVSISVSPTRDDRATVQVELDGALLLGLAERLAGPVRG